MRGGGGRSGWGRRGASGRGVRVDVNREVKFLSKFKKKIEGGVGVEWRGSDHGLGWGRWGSKVRGRRVMWGMGDVNQE